MKKLFLIQTILFFFISCGGQTLELDKAKTISESVLNIIKEEKFDNFSENYTSDFFQQVTVEQWKEDLKKVNELLGAIESYQLIETNFENNIGQPSDIVLAYEVQHSKFKSQHIFTVIIENGKHKVRGHKIKSDAL